MFLKVKHANVPLNYLNIYLKSKVVLQVNNLGQRGSADKKYEYAWPTPYLCRATIIFFRSSESSLPWGAILNFQWPVWESESDNTKFNTPAFHSHLRHCNTNESHDTGDRKWQIGPNLDIFT